MITEKPTKKPTLFVKVIQRYLRKERPSVHLFTNNLELGEVVKREISSKITSQAADGEVGGILILPEKGIFEICNIATGEEKKLKINGIKNGQQIGLIHTHISDEEIPLEKTAIMHSHDFGAFMAGPRAISMVVKQERIMVAFKTRYTPRVNRGTMGSWTAKIEYQWKKYLLKAHNPIEEAVQAYQQALKDVCRAFGIVIYIGGLSDLYLRRFV